MVRAIMPLFGVVPCGRFHFEAGVGGVCFLGAPYLYPPMCRVLWSFFLDVGVSFCRLFGRTMGLSRGIFFRSVLDSISSVKR